MSDVLLVRANGQHVMVSQAEVVALTKPCACRNYGVPHTVLPSCPLGESTTVQDLSENR